MLLLHSFHPSCCEFAVTPSFPKAFYPASLSNQTTSEADILPQILHPQPIPALVSTPFSVFISVNFEVYYFTHSVSFSFFPVHYCEGFPPVISTHIFYKLSNRPLTWHRDGRGRVSHVLCKQTSSLAKLLFKLGSRRGLPSQAHICVQGVDTVVPVLKKGITPGCRIQPLLLGASQLQARAPPPLSPLNRSTSFIFLSI